MPPGPVRTCIGCRTRRLQHELVRITVDPAGLLLVDRHAPGRGAWLCSNSSGCLGLAIKHRAIERALKRQLAPGAAGSLQEAFGAVAPDVADSLAVGRPPDRQQTKG